MSRYNPNLLFVLPLQKAWGKWQPEMTRQAASSQFGLTKPVLLFAQLAVGPRFGVAQLMLDRLQGLQKRKHGFEVIISHLVSTVCQLLNPVLLTLDAGR
jgi:hypothetical protein